MEPLALIFFNVILFLLLRLWSRSSQKERERKTESFISSNKELTDAIRKDSKEIRE